MSHDDDDTKRYRAYIDCDSCGRNHPTLRCSRCKGMFYCNVDCQRQHWSQGKHKHQCTSIVIPKSSMTIHDDMGQPTAAKTLEENADGGAKNTMCGICWEDPIAKPVVLPECRHAFCFVCLKNWQGNFRVDPSNIMEHMSGQTENITKTCPTCRTGIPQTVVQNALVKALFYSNSARRVAVHTTKATMTTKKNNALNDSKGASTINANSNSGKDERSRLFGLALDELDNVLECDAEDMEALTIQARILLQVQRPLEAIQVVHRIFEIHKQGSLKVEQLKKKLLGVMTAGSKVLSDARMAAIDAHYGHVEPWPRSLGDEPRSLFPLRLVLAEAYVATNQLNKAMNEYMQITNYYCQFPRDHQLDEAETRDTHKFSQGSSRCLLKLGKTEMALFSAQNGLRCRRNAPGGHKLLAEAQRAMARHNASGVPSRDKYHPLPSSATSGISLTDAIHTMYRSLVYETPWGDAANEQSNRLFLQELLDEETANKASRQKR